MGEKMSVLNEYEEDDVVEILTEIYGKERALEIINSLNYLASVKSNFKNEIRDVLKALI